jgi:hypothetical protein
MIICSLAMFIFSILSVVPETSPAVIPADEMRLEAQKLQILKGESGLKHDGVWGDGGRAYGIAQFHQATFNTLKKLAGRPELKWKSEKDQLWLFDWAIRNGHAHNWTVARWLAAEEEPAYQIAKKHIIKKGSARCPTRKLVKKSAPPSPPPIDPVPAVSIPSGPVRRKEAARKMKRQRRKRKQGA